MEAYSLQQKQQPFPLYTVCLSESLSTKEIKIKDLWDLMVDSAKTTGGIMLIVASASLFSFVCTKFGIAQAASDLLGSVAHNQFTFLLIVNIIFS